MAGVYILLTFKSNKLVVCFFKNTSVGGVIESF